uniref:PepSY domain-containing protein n=1 Tax=Acetatifactor sp. TaxID=1872090 RepID=UPI0040567BA0
MIFRFSVSFFITILLIFGLTSCGASQNEAVDIALSHAGLSVKDISGLSTEFDNDDGFSKYEVKFYYNNIEYEYEIDADSGDILMIDKDIQQYE